MFLKTFFKRGTALVAAAAMFQAPLAFADSVVTPQPGGPAVVRQVMVAHEPSLSQAQEIALLRRHVKYVFIIFQENRSFRFLCPSAPFHGAHSLFSQPAAHSARASPSRL